MIDETVYIKKLQCVRESETDFDEKVNKYYLLSSLI